MNSNCNKREECSMKNSLESVTASDSNVVLNSIKNSGPALVKRKDSINCKEFEDHIVENNRHSKKKNSKSKQNHENCSLEPDLIELKKSQPRNSWTRFLKPPFSFHSCSNVNNKPSVATQTSSDNTDDSIKSLKELDIIGDENINCFLNIENNARCKAKNKNESKYIIEGKGCMKKLNDILPEEETSSTTTETSTTESDISEKDHRLPDVCVTSKTQKSRFSKNKSRDTRTDTGLRTSTKSTEIDAEGFELSTKSRGHKKIKVDPNKVFRGDILRPSTLELPYKPKPVMPENKLDALERSCSEDSPSGLSPPLTNSNDDALNDIVERTQNFAIHQGYHNCLWYKSSLDSSQSLLSHDSSFSKCPSSYSAVLSRDIISKNKEISNNSGCSVNRSCLDPFKPLITSRAKHSQTCYSAKNTNKQTGIFSSSIWTDNLPHVNSPETQDNLSGSKLKNWMVQSNSDYCPSVLAQHIIPKNNLTLDDHRLLQIYDNITLEKYGWTAEPQAQISESTFGVENHSLQNHAVFGDWPGINLAPIGESLWDSNYNPSSNGSWTDDTNISTEILNPISNTCQTPSPNNVWNNNSLSSVWKSDGSSWSSPSCDNCSPVGGIDNDSMSMNSGTSKNISAVGDFDPFHTPSALWMSELQDKESYSAAPETTTWSFSLFSDPSSVLGSNNPIEQDNEEEQNEEKKSESAV